MSPMPQVRPNPASGVLRSRFGDEGIIDHSRLSPDADSWRNLGKTFTPCQARYNQLRASLLIESADAAIFRGGGGAWFAFFLATEGVLVGRTQVFAFHASGGK
jgi:hypothetical protein